ncbi:FtsX-like permease family protein [Pelagibacterium xiamenense]|uniref:FtsX-like permease family protein n=1 Tax=Pelagibacterium xiamenense TaxID=2901140 RepID=UPI001E4F20C9|nr:FtsX-like permease family protein [Pelagibacterium xiamenense]MCD7059844.1 FtsX-like permease family protein [Pelagibacterium xiamenense]
MLDPVFMVWDGLPVAAQDALLFVLLLLPAVLVGLLVVLGFRPMTLVRAMMWRFKWTNLLFIALIAVSVGIGVGLIAQERGLRQGTARAADKFDLVVSAPGSEITMLFAAVYLQPSDVPLLTGAQYNAIANAENVALAAPIAFGDSYRSAPVVGTTADFVLHMTDELADGRLFEVHTDAVIGANVALALGDRFSPAHGVAGAADDSAHAHFEYEVVGRMQPTGSPWDKAILVPVEAVWEVHGLPNGHAPDDAGRIGPPFLAEQFPGTPAVLVRAEELWANYALRSQFTTDETMAFFPGAVLASLHGLMGDVREVMSVMAIVTQVLVTAGVLAGLVILTRLFARRLALLRALGAPRRFVFSVIWSYASVLIGSGAVLGIVVGLAATEAISRIVTARTDILVRSSLGWPELHLVAAFVSVTVVLALTPAFIALSRPVVTDLRG